MKQGPKIERFSKTSFNAIAPNDHYLSFSRNRNFNKFLFFETKLLPIQMNSRNLRVNLITAILAFEGIEIQFPFPIFSFLRLNYTANKFELFLFSFLRLNYSPFK